jgi:CHAD domain-containing protein
MSDPETKLDSITGALRKQSQTLFRELPKALAGEEEPLHQMRVGARRLRAALPLLARKPRGKKVKRATRLIKELIQKAGASRDLDVCTGLFEEHLKGAAALSPPQRVLLKGLRLARNRSRRGMVEALLDIDIADLRAHLRGIVSRGGEDLFTVLRRGKREREARGQELVEALEALGDRYDPDALHEIRIRCRRLRYVLELTDALKGVHSRAPDLLKTLQGQLGQIHDDHVLAQWFLVQGTRAADNNDRALEVEAARQEALFLERGRRRHREFVDDMPSSRLREALGLSARMAPMLQPFLGSPWGDR